MVLESTGLAGTYVIATCGKLESSYRYLSSAFEEIISLNRSPFFI